MSWGICCQAQFELDQALYAIASVMQLGQALLLRCLASTDDCGNKDIHTQSADHVGIMTCACIVKVAGVLERAWQVLLLNQPAIWQAYSLVESSFDQGFVSTCLMWPAKNS
jgi:hypothetical protein